MQPTETTLPQVIGDCEELPNRAWRSLVWTCWACLPPICPCDTQNA